MMSNWKNMEYLTDAELEPLIRETECNELVPAAPDLRDMILEALEREANVWVQEPDAPVREAIASELNLSAVRKLEERDSNEKILAFKRYRFRVLTTVAAAVAVVFLLPKLEDLQPTEDSFPKSLQKQEYMMQSRYETKEEALNDSGMLETLLGGVNIFADNSRFNLFRE